MILEEETKEAFGYYVSALKLKSNKLIIAACELCGKFKIIERDNYYTFCHSCSIRLGEAMKGNTYALGFKRSNTTNAKMEGNTNALGYKHTDETKAKNRAAIKLLWEDPVYIAKVLKARHASPNKLERKMLSILERLAPGKWIFNGDFSAGVSIGRRIPDFVSVDNKKVVIEVFGAYFHDPMKNRKVKTNRTYLETITHYKRYGYKCIIVWDQDVREAFVQKLLRDKSIIV